MWHKEVKFRTSAWLQTIAMTQRIKEKLLKRLHKLLLHKTLLLMLTKKEIEVDFANSSKQQQQQHQ